MKKNIYISFIIIMGFFCSCQEKKVEIPKDVISQDEMVDIITEVEITQALIKFKLSSRDTLNQEELFASVYKDFDTSQEQFNKSLMFYSKHPELLEKIYTRVVNNLSEKQAENN